MIIRLPRRRTKEEKLAAYILKHDGCEILPAGVCVPGHPRWLYPRDPFFPSLQVACNFPVWGRTKCDRVLGHQDDHASYGMTDQGTCLLARRKHEPND